MDEFAGGELLQLSVRYFDEREAISSHPFLSHHTNLPTDICLVIPQSLNQGGSCDIIYE